MDDHDGARPDRSGAPVNISDDRPLDEPDSTRCHTSPNRVLSSTTALQPRTNERDGYRRRMDEREQWQHRVWKALTHDAGMAVLLGLLLAAVFGALGAVASLGGTTNYTSTTVMLIDDPYQLATSGDDSWFVKLDALRVKYSGLISTDAIAQPVARQLHLSLGSVLGAVSAQVPYTSLLMSVEATWSTPHEAQVLSQAVANEVTDYVRAEEVTYGVPPVDRFTLTTIDPASAAVAQGPSKTHAVTLAVGLAVLGFLLGFVATQLARYLR